MVESLVCTWPNLQCSDCGGKGHAQDLQGRTYCIRCGAERSSVTPTTARELIVKWRPKGEVPSYDEAVTKGLEMCDD